MRASAWTGHMLAGRITGLRRGVTLLESLIAAGILLIAVVAVSAAITSGQQHAFEAQLRISGAIAAEDLMARLSDAEYNDLQFNWNGFEELPGQMLTQQGVAFPEAFDLIGRRVSLSSSMHMVPGVNVIVYGLIARVEAVDFRGDTLVRLERFIPQPQQLTITNINLDDDIEDGGLVRHLLEETTLLEDAVDAALDLLNGTAGALGL